MSNTFEIYKRGKFQDIAIVNEHPKTSVPAWSWSSSTHARNGSQPCKRPRSRILDSREIRGRFWLDGPRTHRMASAYNWPLDHSIDSLRRDILFYLIIIFFFFFESDLLTSDSEIHFFAILRSDTRLKLCFLFDYFAKTNDLRGVKGN